jgi:hypothetical protein
MSDDLYKDNFSEVFGDKPVERGSWVFDRAKGTLVPRDEYINPTDSVNAPSVLKPLDPFVSPIDGRLIDDRSQLRAHNKEHGVTNVADYGEGYFERRGKEKYNDSIGNTKEAKLERVDALKRSMHKLGLL